MPGPNEKAAKPSRRPGSGGAARSGARLAAVQGLYQMDIAGTGLDTVIGERLNYGFGGDLAGEPVDGDGGREDSIADGEAMVAPDQVFLTELLRGVMRRQVDIDRSIDEQLAEGWRLVRIDSTVRAILRAGVFELLERADVPAKVAISEYVAVAHAFFSGEEPKVVNGVLDALARQLRPAEFGVQGV